jgi:hypothetical protein
MNMALPPRWAECVLAAALPPADRDSVIGDLREEFATTAVPVRGCGRARWWYRVQVARSLAPIAVRAWQRASLLHASVVIVCAAAASVLPALMLVALRAFVLQQVPLKTTPEASVQFLTLLAATLGGSLLVSVAGAMSALQRPSSQAPPPDALHPSGT